MTMKQQNNNKMTKSFFECDSIDAACLNCELISQEEVPSNYEEYLFNIERFVYHIPLTLGIYDIISSDSYKFELNKNILRICNIENSNTKIKLKEQEHVNNNIEKFSFKYINHYHIKTSSIEDGNALNLHDLDMNLFSKFESFLKTKKIENLIINHLQSDVSFYCVLIDFTKPTVFDKLRNRVETICKNGYFPSSDYQDGLNIYKEFQDGKYD